MTSHRPTYQRHLTDSERRDTVDARIEYELRQAERFGDEKTAAQLRRERLENALEGFHIARRRAPKTTTEHESGAPDGPDPIDQAELLERPGGRFTAA